MNPKRKINVFILSLLSLLLITASLFAQEDPNIPVTEIYRPPDATEMLNLKGDFNGTEFLKFSTMALQTEAVALPKVAVIGSCTNAVWRNDVISKLSATGLFSQIDGYDGFTSTPSLATLQQYDSVLVYSDCGFQNNVAMGNVLADYVDSGGGLVVSTFAFWTSNAGLGMGGRLSTGNFLPFTQAAQSSGIELSLVKDNPSHPILDGVNTLLGGQSSYHNNSIAVASGANLIAHWSNGQPLVGTKEINGNRVVGLNFYPPSNSIRTDFWRANTDGGRLMGNALVWAANSNCSNQDVLIIYDTNNGNTQALKTALENAGLNVTLSQTSETGYNGTNPSPNGFDAVIHMNGSTPYDAMPAAGQQALVNYVQNGGGYIGGAWNTYEIQFGNVQAMRDLILFTNYNGGNNPPVTLLDAAGQAGHPILSNVPSSFSVDTSSELVSVYPFATSPVTTLMVTQQHNRPLLAVRELGQGRVVHFGIAPNWNGGDTSLSNAHVQQIFIDSIKWAGAANCNTNAAPTAVADSYSTDEDTVLSVSAAGVLGNDTDNDGNALSAVLVSGPSNALSFTLNSDGSFVYSPNFEFNGADSFTYKANDGQADSSAVTVSITVNPVNDAPSLAGVPASATIDELVAYAFTASATDIDNTGQTLNFSLVGAPSGAAIDASTGAFSWTPDETQGPGNYPFTVRVSDGEANTDEVISLTVNEINVAPTLSNVPSSATINELAAYGFTATSSDADVPAQTLTYSLVGAPAGAGIDPSTGQFTWTPSEAQGDGSTYVFAVRVSDGVVNTDVSVSLTVNEVNSAPVLNGMADQTVNELTAFNFTASASDDDLPANNLNFSLENAPLGMTIDASSGQFSWTPTETQGVGDYAVTVRVSDGDLSDSKLLNIHVNEVNEAPVLGAVGNRTTDEQTAFTFSATATDEDLNPDNTPANSLTFSLLNAPAGASIDPGTGQFSWTPTEAQGPADYTFTVKVTDDGAPAKSDEETITITVNEVNLPPVLGTIGNQTGYWNNVVGFTASANDPDIPANNLTFSLVGAPAGAAIHPTSGVFAWIPNSGQIGQHTFKVRVTDDGTPAASDEETITVTVGKRPTAILYTGDETEQYSDQQALTAILTDAGLGIGTGNGLDGKEVGFTIGTQNASAQTDGFGAASTNLILTQDPAPIYSVVSHFAGDALYLPATDTDDFDITREDARTYYTGTLFVNTACATCGTATATLSATVKDITAENADGAYDALEGDIRNATVTFINRETNTEIATVPIGLVSSDKKIGTATYNWNVNIGSLDSDSLAVGIRVNNFYTRDSSTEDVVVTVSKPIGTNFITGGGFLSMQNSSGIYAGTPGTKTNFGFNVKYNKSGKSLQGRVNVIVRSGGRVYQIKGNVMSTLTVNNSNPSALKAVYTGKANVADVTDPYNPIPISGNNTFQMELTDKGEPGSSDTIGINVWSDAGGIMFSSNWNGTRTVEQLLGGGNLVIR